LITWKILKTRKPNMTTKEMIAVMEHYDKGGKVESKPVGRNWNIDDNPTWDFEHIEYRIKEEESKVIPWTFENAPVHAIKVKDKDGNFSVLYLTTISDRICFVNSRTGTIISAKEAAEKYVQLDGSPCGTIVNE